jgi:molybdopterin synthase catalytic subunit
VRHLEYEAFQSLAEREGERIVAEAIEKFGIKRAACVHRVGDLAIGELAVWVGTSSAHRAEAFAACRYIIDAVKHRVPIWKKEHYIDGTSGWVNCERWQPQRLTRPPRHSAQERNPWRMRTRMQTARTATTRAQDRTSISGVRPW